MKVDVLIEKAGNNWCAVAPDLEDVVIATGATRDETIERFREALRGLVDYKRETGQSFPDVTALEIRETLELREALAA